jgi:hypothetical protein
MMQKAAVLLAVGACLGLASCEKSFEQKLAALEAHVEKS